MLVLKSIELLYGKEAVQSANTIKVEANNKHLLGIHNNLYVINICILYGCEVY